MFLLFFLASVLSILIFRVVRWRLLRRHLKEFSERIVNQEKVVRSIPLEDFLHFFATLTPPPSGAAADAPVNALPAHPRGRRSLRGAGKEALNLKGSTGAATCVIEAAQLSDCPVRPARDTPHPRPHTRETVAALAENCSSGWQAIPDLI